MYPRPLSSRVHSMPARELMVTFGQSSGPIEPIPAILLSQKSSLFFTRPFLFHYIETPQELEASTKELFEMVASGKIKININQHFSLEHSRAHKALESRTTTGATIVTV